MKFINWQGLRRSLKNVKIRTKIFVFLLISISIYISMISFFIFRKMENVIKEEAGTSLIQILEQVNKNIDYNINKCELSFISFYAGGRFESLIPKHIYNYNDMLLYFRAINNQVGTFANVNSGVVGLRIFSFDDSIPWDNLTIYSAGVIANEAWTKPLLKWNDDPLFYWTSELDDTGINTDDDVVFCYTSVYDDMDQSLQAVLRMDIDKNSLFSAIDTLELENKSSIFIAREDGEIIYNNIRDGQYSYAVQKAKIDFINKSGKNSDASVININGVNELLVFSKNNRLNWLVIGSVPYYEYLSGVKDIQKYLLFVSLLSITIGLFTTYIFSKLVTKRITQLYRYIDQAIDGDFDIDVNVGGNDEIGQVSRHFAYLLSVIKQLIEKTELQFKKEHTLINEKYELELLKKEAELRALQNQINPHFIYNTLEMIKGLLYSNDPQNRIVTAIQALSNTFKYNLSVDYIVRVIDEVEHAKNYIEIHNLRFDWQVKLVNEIDQSALNTKIVRFTFEPIIENAIVHGLREIQKDSCIYFRSYYDDDSLIITIQNEGKAIDLDKLSEIQNRIKDKSKNYSFNPERQGGLGLHNVNERIKGYFGIEYGLSINSDEINGTIVCIKLPAESRNR